MIPLNGNSWDIMGNSGASMLIAGGKPCSKRKFRSQTIHSIMSVQATTGMTESRLFVTTN